MRQNQVISVLAVFLLAFSISTGQTRKVPSPQATEIANIDRYTAQLDRFVKRNQRRALIFADVSSDNTDEKSSWKKFKSEKQREQADTGENLNENAYVWSRAGKVVAVNFTFQSPSRDWAHFVMYYFRDDGSLAKIHSQLNTFYGDVSVVRDQHYSRDGKLLKTRQRLLDLKTQKPKKAADFQNEPIPVFNKVSELPFYKLL